MELERSESRRSKYEDMEESPIKKHRDDAREPDDDGAEEEGEVQATKDSRHSRDRDRKRTNVGSEKDRERQRDRNREHRSKDRDRDYDKTKERERGKDKSGRDSKVKDKERRERDKEKEHKNREKERDRERNRGKDREKVSEIDRERGKERDTKKDYEDGAVQQMDHGEYDDKDSVSKNKKDFFTEQDVQRGVNAAVREPTNTIDIEERIQKMKEERLKKDTEDSEILSWVSKSRKLEEKRNVEKAKAMQLSKLLEEQDNMVLQDDEGYKPSKNHDLAGVKILHGLEKAIEGGSVVLTLKDQSILADGDINQEAEVLENVEIGEQKRRAEAYKAAKKKPGVYDDKFNDDFSSEKKILPQYDDPPAEEGITLDERGRFSGAAERKLDELRRRLEGSSGATRFEDLTKSNTTSSDYYTQEEMLKFKKPKKKKSLRKKEKLDVDALEAEAISAGLGAEDLGSRNDPERKAQKEEQEKAAERQRSNAYQAAFARADEASNLRKASTEKEENETFIDDDDDLNKSVANARRSALQEQAKNRSLLEIARLATQPRNENPENEEAQENRVIFTEVEEFVWGLQLDEDTQKPSADDVFKDDDDSPMEDPETEKEKDNMDIEQPKEGDETEEPDVDETLHERPVGKGLSGVLSLLKERGALKESVDWGGRNMDKKKSKLVGIVNDDASSKKFKDIRIERTDEFGRIMTPKEAFRRISHKFHGKGPGKMKQEKRMKQYQEELKLKQMKNSDTPSLSVERMREAQAQLKTPYLVLSGNAKNAQILEGTGLEKDVPGALTPMLGDKKVEFFLGGMKRKTDFSASNVFKKPKI